MDRIKNSKTYFDVLARSMHAMSYSGVDQIATELLQAYECGRSIYILGNGGSAATASHFACDLGKGTAKWLNHGDRRFRVLALTDNIPVLTAWANDSSYEDVFAEQLRNLVRPGDVVLAISGSGNSPNVLKAIEVANRSGAHTIGFTGFAGGQMKRLCRTCLVVPSSDMEIIEDLHLAVCHALATIIRAALSETARTSFSASEAFLHLSETGLRSSSRTNTTALSDNAPLPVDLPSHFPGASVGSTGQIRQTTDGD